MNGGYQLILFATKTFQIGRKLRSGKEIRTKGNIHSASMLVVSHTKLDPSNNVLEMGTTTFDKLIKTFSKKLKSMNE